MAGVINCGSEMLQDRLCLAESQNNSRRLTGYYARHWVAPHRAA
jgi:hypothetical protein